MLHPLHMHSMALVAMAIHVALVACVAPVGLAVHVAHIAEPCCTRCTIIDGTCCTCCTHWTCISPKTLITPIAHDFLPKAASPHIGWQRYFLPRIHNQGDPSPVSGKLTAQSDSTHLRNTISHAFGGVHEKHKQGNCRHGRPCPF